MSGAATCWEEAYRAQVEAIKELRAENAALRELTATLGAPNHVGVPVPQWQALRADKERLDWLHCSAEGLDWQLRNTKRITRDSIDAAMGEANQ